MNHSMHGNNTHEIPVPPLPIRMLWQENSLSKPYTARFKDPDLEGTAGCVLVIDDEQSTIDLIKTFLAPHGITVHGFVNPYEAVEWFESQWRSVDLVFLDMKNPHMNGEFTFALLQSIHFDVRIALMSGGVDMLTVNELLDEGALQFFAKPFNLPSVIDWAMTSGIVKR